MGFGVAVGELLAAFISPAASAVSSVGQYVIGALPGGMKEWAIHLFGTNDKAALLTSIAILMAIFAIVAGLLERVRFSLGLGLIALFGVLGILAVAANSSATGLSYVGPVVIAVVAIWFLVFLERHFLRPDLGRELKAEYVAAQRNAGPTPGEPMAPKATVEGLAGAGSSADGPSLVEIQAQKLARRSFFQYVIGGAAVAVVLGGAATLVRKSAVVVAGLREKVVLPKALKPAPVIPAGASLDISGISPLVTPVDDFYRIDTAFVVPSVDSDTWTLKVTGMVEKEVSITFAELLAKPMMENYVTIGCVSNEVGGDLVGNAKWLGWPVRELLAMAGVKSGADMVLSTSQDGFTAGTPLEAMTDSRNALIAIGMDGEALPLEHGYPARIIVPGLYGYVSATKWVTELKVTTFAADQGYWTPLGWSALGPIKTASRIDVPKKGAKVGAGTITVAGLAWSPLQGISAVQVQLDGGDWQEARLAVALNKDTWVQWQADISVSSGDHVVQVRAVDGNGKPQIEAEAPPAPNGASGYHSVKFSAK